MTASLLSRSRRPSLAPKLWSKPSLTKRGANIARRSLPLPDWRTRRRSSRWRRLWRCRKRSAATALIAKSRSSANRTEPAAGIYAGLAALRGGARSRPESSPATEQPSAGSQQHPSLPGLSGDAGSPSDLFSRTRQQIVELRQRAASEKKPDKLRVYRRALSGVFIGAVEAGEGSLDAKSYSLAAEYFQLASDANPESGGVLQALARAEALANDRKAALQALHRAREKARICRRSQPGLTRSPPSPSSVKIPSFGLWWPLPSTGLKVLLQRHGFTGC